MHAAINLGDIYKAKSWLDEATSLAMTASQVVVPCLDVADFLTSYKSERSNVVEILADAEGWAIDAPVVIQKRYWRTRRDATMRLAGFNDFRNIPLIEFAETIGEIKNPSTSKAWMKFTISFERAYEKNKAHWVTKMKEELTMKDLNSLLVYYPPGKIVIKQLKTLEPVLGPTVKTK